MGGVHAVATLLKNRMLRQRYVALIMHNIYVIFLRYGMKKIHPYLENIIYLSNNMKCLSKKIIIKT